MHKCPKKHVQKFAFHSLIKCDPNKKKKKMANQLQILGNADKLNIHIWRPNINAFECIFNHILIQTQLKLKLFAF